MYSVNRHGQSHTDTFNVCGVHSYVNGITFTTIIEEKVYRHNCYVITLKKTVMELCQYRDFKVIGSGRDLDRGVTKKKEREKVFYLFMLEIGFLGPLGTQCHTHTATQLNITFFFNENITYLLISLASLLLIFHTSIVLSLRSLFKSIIDQEIIPFKSPFTYRTATLTHCHLVKIK